MCLTGTAFASGKNRNVDTVTQYAAAAAQTAPDGHVRFAEDEQEPSASQERKFNLDLRELGEALGLAGGRGVAADNLFHKL